MSDKTFNLISPTGDELQGTMEKLIGTCGVEFTDADGTTSYEHDSGGTNVDWDSSETASIDGRPMFVDASGRDWLAHHLIEDWRDPLSAETIAVFEREMRIGEALDVAKALVKAMGAGVPLGDYDDVQGGFFDYAALLRKLHEGLYEKAKAASIAAKAGELATRDATMLFGDDIGWTFADQRAAQAEGWELSEYGDGHVAIGADDDSDIFTGDRANVDAFDHVVWAAANPQCDNEYGEGYAARCSRALDIHNRTATEAAAWRAESGNN